MLRLSANPGSFSGASVFAEQLLIVFTDAVKFLEKFQSASKQKGFLQIVKSRIALYSASSVDEFQDFHNQLTVIMQDRSFALSVSEEDAIRPPSLEEIQRGMQQEVAHVVNELQKVSLETGDRLEHFEGQLNSFLASMKTSLPNSYKDLAILDDRSLQINKNEILGKGASGTVYAGLLYGSTEVAVKILSSATIIDNDTAIAELQKELERTLRVGNHRNIIKVYGMVMRCAAFTERKSPPAVVMERLGKTLESVSHKLPPAQLMKLSHDIICGMARVHDFEEGVVHFDLKPQNVLLTRDGRTAKITDFGIAQTKTTVAFASASDTAMARGTVAYMAPEIFLGTSRGFPCDVYSFALVLYALWSGRAPWKGFSDDAVVNAVQQGSRPAEDIEMVNWGVPEPIVALIVACWDQSPGSRPSFKTMLQLREIDFFWEAPVRRWPPYLVMVYNAMGGVGVLEKSPESSDKSNGSAYTSQPSTYTTNSSANTVSSGKNSFAPNSGGVHGVAGASTVSSLSYEQLRSYLQEVYGIDESVLVWLEEKKINGDMFLGSGSKIIQRLRSIADIDEWHVDSLERCHQRITAQAEAEAKRQQALLDARQAVANATRQKKLDEENKRLEELRRETERVAKEKELEEAAAAEARKVELELEAEIRRQKLQKEKAAAEHILEMQREKLKQEKLAAEQANRIQRAREEEELRIINVRKRNKRTTERLFSFLLAGDYNALMRALPSLYSPRYTRVTYIKDKPPSHGQYSDLPKTYDLVMNKWKGRYLMCEILADHFQKADDPNVLFCHYKSRYGTNNWGCQLTLRFDEEGLISYAEYRSNPC